MRGIPLAERSLHQSFFLLMNTVASEKFITELTSSQMALNAYILFLVGGIDDAKDILQEANLVLWREAQRYDESRPFLPWAKRIAYFQVKTWRTKKKRSKLVFDDELLQKIAVFADEEPDMNMMLSALEKCFQKLNASQKAIITSRYTREKSVKSIADALRCTAASVSMLLFRVRDKLGRCVEKIVRTEESYANG